MKSFFVILYSENIIKDKTFLMDGVFSRIFAPTNPAKSLNSPSDFKSEEPCNM